jgi:hypothetical protein
VDDYGNDNYKFTAWDQVYICYSGTQDRYGPYRIQETEDGKYKLCDDDGNSVNNGELYEEKDLVLYNPFEA